MRSAVSVSVSSETALRVFSQLTPVLMGCSAGSLVSTEYVLLTGCRETSAWKFQFGFSRQVEMESDEFEPRCSLVLNGLLESETGSLGSPALIRTSFHRAPIGLVLGVFDMLGLVTTA